MMEDEIRRKVEKVGGNECKEGMKGRRRKKYEGTGREKEGRIRKKKDG